ncbi:hypothetical protein TVAG_227030 [Trichomonas vaginalis G3]|uniref:Uncharacterized protein n=1 Tax=Trichomonas vaginalis (strain ATCC PRA-98 / G3) TaxID=412133 RepID=A2FFU7_TRIV3|nr:YVTN repeat-like/Quinoprotein amine dehydrogenase family [Trichomonas vaginalis G3]EAX96208.1 hypothetical protein TVAG_227030 [Trichomonas vaginalis G3]KAI5496659.1 YVTN repeat-like/Quinoprotein amine dehydrogenase family [Trichomonas vaginalis G3]|eukprot:XP_001309138.1 hypothetical protein [Trichomonas vaginalis G3]
MKNTLYPIGSDFIYIKSIGYVFNHVDGLKINEIKPKFLINGQINNIFPTIDPLLTETGYIIQSNENQFLIYTDSDQDLRDLKITIPNGINLNQITFFLYQTMLVINSGKLIVTDSSQNVIFEHELPYDSYFISHNSTQALIVSNSENFVAIVTYLDQTEIEFVTLPGGYSVMTCADIFDDQSIAFASKDNQIYLYSADDEIKSVSLPEQIIRIKSLDIDPFERACAVLSVTNRLYYVRFDSETVTEVIDNVIDFCVINNPFDMVIVNTGEDDLKVVNQLGIKILEPSMQSMVDALSTRVVASLSYVSKTRERLTLRKSLSDGKEIELPKMKAMFGEKPNPPEEQKEDTVKQDFWIENVTDSSFIIKSHDLISPDIAVFLTSDTIGFEAQTEVVALNETSIQVNYDISITFCSTISPLHIYIIFEGISYYVGDIHLPPKYVMSSRELNRIHISYTVSFHSNGHRYPTSHLPHDKNQPIWIEDIDGGVILHIKGDSCSHFSQRLLAAASLLPSSAIFMKIEHEKCKNMAAKNIARIVSKFTQIPPNPNIDCDILLDFKAALDESFAVLLSYC